MITTTAGDLILEGYNIVGTNTNGGVNTNTGTLNTIFGYGNVVSGNAHFVGGYGNTIAGIAGVIVGNGNNVSADSGMAFGLSGIVTAGYATAFGIGNTAGVPASAAFGWGSVAWLYGSIVYQSRTFDGDGHDGTAQTSLLTGGQVTADATPTECSYAYNNGAYLVLENDHSYYFEIIVVGRNKGNDAESASYKFEGVATRGVDASTTAIFGLTKTVIYEADANWDANVTADTTNGRIACTVTGVAATNIQWTASVKIVGAKG